MKALKHKNIVNLRQVLTSSSKLYIVMDLVTGGELFTKILNEGKLEENVARSYFQQLVDGIEYCHRRGVCHRDLKPENLLIDETTGELKITDFGLSAMKGASTTEELLHTQCGSPNYCAPEIIARHRQGYNGAKVDAWSCGIILFALLAGFLPFYDENTKVLYRMIQRDDVKFPRKFPPEAKDLVLKLLHKEPERRYTLQEVKRHPWFSVGYSSESSTSSNSSPPSSSQGRSRRRRGHNRTRSTDTGPRSRTASDAIPPAPATPPAPQAAPPLPTPPVVPQQAPATPPVPAPPAVRTAPPPPPPPPPARVSAPPVAPPVAPQVAPRVAPAAAPPVAPPTRASAPPNVPVVRNLPESASPARASVPIPPPPPLLVSPPAASVNPPAPLVPPPIYSKPVPPPPQLPVIPKAVVAEASVHHPPPVPPPSRTVASPKQVVNASPPPIVPPPNMTKTPVTASPLRHNAPSPPGPPPARLTREYTKTVDVGDQRDPGVGDTMPADARNESLPEVEKDVMFSNPVALPAPSSSPVTSSSEVNPISSGSIPIAPPKPEVPTYSAAAPPSEVTRAENIPNSAPLPLSSIYAKEEAPLVVKASHSSQSAGRSDTSWQRHASPEQSMAQEPKPAETIPAQQPQAEATSPAPSPASVGMSFVEQRRAMYDKLAGGKAINPVPITDSSRGTTSAEWDSDFSAPKSTPLPRILKKDPVSIPRKISVPNTGSVQRRHDEMPQMPHNLQPVSNGQTDTNARIPDPNPVVFPVVAPVVPPPVSPVVPEVQVPAVKTPAETERTSNGIVQVNEANQSEKLDRKKRTRAALARYRRIFRLGNNIGITGSPSFNSNQGKLATVDEGKPENSPSRAEFFARAKAVTGAWGVILTQELEEDSDSEDDERQVTDEELAAFGKLLDFWDNRRASATMSQKDEVVLDDEHSTPLTEHDITSIQSLLGKLEPKREDDVEEVAQPASIELYGNGQDQSDEIRQLLERDFSNPSVDSAGNQPGSPRPRSVSNMEQSLKTGIRMSASVDILSARMQEGQTTAAPPPPPPPPPPPMPPAGGRVIGAPPPPNRSGGVFPPPPAQYSSTAQETTVTPPRLTVTQSTLRDPFRPKLPPSYPSGQFPGPAGLNDSFPTVSTKARIEANQLARGGAKIPQSISMDDRLAAIANRKSSNEKKPSSGSIERKPSSSRDLGRDDTTHSEGSVVGGRTSISKNNHIRTPSRDEHATRGMFAFSMFSRKKSGAASSFDANLPLDKCLVEVGRILQSLGCSVMMKRGESKMKCEAPVKNSEKMLVSVTCTHSGGKTKVMFKKGKRDRSRVDAKEFYEFFQTVYNKFLQKIESESNS